MSIHHRQSPRRLALATVLAAGLLSGLPVPASGRADASEAAAERPGISFRIDNDSLSSRHDDKDYTGGLALTLTGATARNSVLSLDGVLARLDAFLGATRGPADAVVHSLETGIAAFTPEDITTEALLPRERPYASLVYLSSTRQRVALQPRTSTITTLTLGLLGTRFPGELQNTFHGLTHSERARGWAHQVSRGGEPTLRYRIAWQQVRASRPARPGRPDLEVKTATQASLGFVTEMAWSASARWGKVRSPWWTFNPHLWLYGEHSEPEAFRRTYRGGRDLYWLAGFTVRLRAYNAFLQGQFRDSPVELKGGALNPLIGEAWVGVTAGLPYGLRLSYLLRGHTADIADGPAGRNPVWGSLTISRAF